MCLHLPATTSVSEHLIKASLINTRRRRKYNKGVDELANRKQISHPHRFAQCSMVSWKVMEDSQGQSGFSAGL